jgi:hypothetical protein
LQSIKHFRLPIRLHFQDRAVAMADQSKARPVSGEIMAGAPLAGGYFQAPAADIVDAEYETIPAAAPERPAATIASTEALPAGMDMLRRTERAAARKHFVRAGPAFWIFGVAIAAASFWVAGGHVLVRDLPAFAQGASAGALRISGVTSRVEGPSARPLLFVDGEAANDGDAAQALPPLEIVVAGLDGRVTRYRLGTNGRALAPGEIFAFSSRLDAPKSGVLKVSVAFGS